MHDVCKLGHVTCCGGNTHKKVSSENGTTFNCILEAARSFKTLQVWGTSFLCPGFLKIPLILKINGYFH